MLYVPTWYPGRAFQPQENGGQDPNWHFGMLRYPSWEDGKGNDLLWNSFESGYAVLSTTEHPDVAGDILAFAAQPKYGALWTAVTNSPSAIKYDVETDWPSEELQEALGAVPGQWDWYWEEFAKVYGTMTPAIGMTTRCGDFEAAVVAALNEGLPLGLLTVDEAIEMLDEALCVE
jgi:hypothetical protein